MSTIDINLSWIRLLPGLLAAIEQGSPNARAQAWGELQRMAQFADAYAVHVSRENPIRNTEH